MANDPTIIPGVYTGAYNTRNLPANWYRQNADVLMGMVQAGGATDELFESLNINAQMFSAAKTYQLVRELEVLSKTAAGYSDYQSKAQALIDKFNKWGEAEENTAKQQTMQAKQWQTIQADVDLFPILKYQTIGDACRICRPLDGLTAPANSYIWHRIYPCNHYNCYCIVIQLTAGEKLTDVEKVQQTVNESTKFMAPTFLSNPGITQQLFTKDHPYFAVPPSDKAFAKTNFGLPIIQ